MKNDWTSLLGNIDPSKVGKLLVVALIMFLITPSVTAQKVVTVHVVENNVVVEKPATFEQVTAKMTKQVYTFTVNGKSEPVYATKSGSCYAIITTSSGIIKKRLKMQI